MGIDVQEVVIGFFQASFDVFGIPRFERGGWLLIRGDRCTGILEPVATEAGGVYHFEGTEFSGLDHFTDFSVGKAYSRVVAFHEAYGVEDVVFFSEIDKFATVGYAADHGFFGEERFARGKDLFAEFVVVVERL